MAPSDDKPPSTQPPEQQVHITVPRAGPFSSPATVDPPIAPLPVAQGQSGSEHPITETTNDPNDQHVGTHDTVTGISAFPDLSKESGQSDPGNVEDVGEDLGTQPMDGGLPTVIGNNDTMATLEDEGHGFGGDTANDTKKFNNLERQLLMVCDHKLLVVYDDTTHCNDGCHLNEGIEDDALWQAWYGKVVSNSHRMYFPPKGAIGRKLS